MIRKPTRGDQLIRFTWDSAGFNTASPVSCASPQSPHLAHEHSGKKQMQVLYNGLSPLSPLSSQILVPQASPRTPHSPRSSGGAGNKAQFQKGFPGLSALFTSEAISELGGQTAKGKRFTRSSHRTETKRNIWNRQQ